jgi:hypothetical protein
MKLWERLSNSFFKLVSSQRLKTFETKRVELMLGKSLKLIENGPWNELKKYVRGKQHQSGGFMDRAGNPDLYYTLFGCYLSEALGLEEMMPGTRKYVENEISKNGLDQVHLYCAVILASKLDIRNKNVRNMLYRIREGVCAEPDRHGEFRAFMSLLYCYYYREYRSLYLLTKMPWETTGSHTAPLPVVAASALLRHSFGKPLAEDVKKLLGFYNDNGGFKATKETPEPDLLSTAVGLYALRVADYDMRTIKPDCLNFIDSLYTDGGFGSGILDRTTDIEYTFYGLLALGSLTD